MLVLLLLDCRLLLCLKLSCCCLGDGSGLLLSWLLWLLLPASHILPLCALLLLLVVAQLAQFLVLLQQACLQQLLSQLPALAGAVKCSSLLPRRISRFVSKHNAPPTSQLSTRAHAASKAVGRRCCRQRRH
jgi:hypothetical protein